ncbi:ribonuclease HII, partial [Leucobacter sp. M11]|nr:ribonuclease HII [Leucobacter sp. M11]
MAEARTPPPGLIPGKDPSLDAERALAAAGFATVIGVDEVGRGAIAGPVSVGVAMIHTDTGEFPVGLRDSKLLSEKRREAIEPEVATWCLGWAVGTATAAEIDEFGITAMLGE